MFNLLEFPSTEPCEPRRQRIAKAVLIFPSAVHAWAPTVPPVAQLQNVQKPGLIRIDSTSLSSTMTLYIHITFTLYIHITFTLHSHYIHIIHSHDIHITFTLYIHIIHSHYIHITFTLHSHYIHIIHSHYIHITFTVFSQT